MACLIGTRPEATKVAPLVTWLQRSPRVAPVVVVTGQHTDLVDGALEPFGVEPDVVLPIERVTGEVDELTGTLIMRIGEWLRANDISVVVVQGDTATALAGAMAAYFNRIPVVHLEAGLRSHRLDSPFPEEGNRQMIGRIADLHLAPTFGAARNLLAEHTDPDAISVIGNTSIDAILQVAPSDRHLDLVDRDVVLVTAHRRESWGAGLKRIAVAVARLAEDFPQFRFVVPVHPNPTVQRSLIPSLAPLANVTIVEPLPYRAFARVLTSARLVITDSGGVQEEAPALGVPVLVTRDVTERGDGVDSGAAKLVGTDPFRIVAEASRLLTDDAAWTAMSTAPNPYGDGHAAWRAVNHIERLLGVDREHHADHTERPERSERSDHTRPCDGPVPEGARVRPTAVAPMVSPEGETHTRRDAPVPSRGVVSLV